MTRVAAKMYISTAATGPDGKCLYSLGVVCRGEENKEWSAATPSGSAKIAATDVLHQVWTEHHVNPQRPVEVLVYQEEDPDGEWKLVDCAFTYGGCSVKFTREGPPYGQELTLNINASPATKTLRAAYAAGLDVGQPPRFTITIEAADETGQA